MKRLIGSILLLFFISNTIYAQDDLLELIDDESEKQPVNATFKGTRLILGHSTKMQAKNTLEFIVSHRFGRVNQGAHDLFGLDDSSVRIALEYAPLDDLNIGVGRNSFDKTFDFFAKYRIVQQSTGPGSFPLSLVVLNSFTIRASPKAEDDPNIAFSDRLANVSQLLIARKISRALSLQLMPSYVYKNSPTPNATGTVGDTNLFAMGIGGRLKITPGVSFNTEYYYRVDPIEGTGRTNAFSVGFDIETGGHVFQLHLTNSVFGFERGIISETFDDFFDGDIHFGFNISRVFQLGGNKKE